MKPHELPGAWRAKAEEIRRFAPTAAEAFEACAEELEQAQRAHDQEPLRLRQAALEGGYDEDSLGRMVKEGRIKNVGRKGAPLIRRCDVPRKPRPVAEATRSLQLGSDNRRALSRRAGRS